MALIQISERSFQHAYSVTDPRPVACPVCDKPVQIVIIRPGMIRYTCSCGKGGAIQVVPDETRRDTDAAR